MAQHHPGTDFQLRGFWLHLARGLWNTLILYELFVIIFTLVTTGGQGLIICPFIISCAITPTPFGNISRVGCDYDVEVRC